MASETAMTSYLEKLRSLQFVRGIDYKPYPDPSDSGVDGVVNIKTPHGRYALSVERRDSYLDRALLNAFIVQARHYSDKRRPLLLFTRYVPRPSAERLIQSGVNFLDRAGNIHLALGNIYVHTIIGKKEERIAADEKSMTPAKVQLMFAFAADKQAGARTVRELASVSGLSKSNVANLRQQLFAQGILGRRGTSFELPSAAAIEEQLLLGYEQILRPKLLFNRFRMAERSPTTGHEKLLLLLCQSSMEWSLTGGVAAFRLQRFYKGPELVVFVKDPPESISRQFQLMPDREGPITILRGFGTLCYFQRVNDFTVAHPWLIYAELMRSDDPRAHEAAAELKSEFLQP